VASSHAGPTRRTRGRARQAAHPRAAGTASWQGRDPTVARNPRGVDPPSVPDPETPRPPLPATSLDDAVLRARLDAVPPSFELPDGMRAAAVVAPVFQRGGEDWLLLLKRRRDLRHHGGEIAFPGGRREPGESPVDCALRELEEEVGIAGEEIEILGALPSMPSLAGFHVHALIGRMPAPAWIWLDQGEIEIALEVRIAELADPGRWSMRVGPGGKRPTPHFDHRGDTLWGLTAWFTRTMLERAGLLDFHEGQDWLRARHRLLANKVP
jgi:8-oxo-dGTP pyrophosphatase MutT (NUDIX family)